MKPHIRLSGRRWVCEFKGQILDDNFNKASRFADSRNKKEGRWPWSIYA